MILKDRLMVDYKDAMKSKDVVKKNTINLARAAIKQEEIDERKQVTEEEVIAILSKQVKMRRDALADFEKAGRTDLANAYKQEIKILSNYLPEMLSKEEIKKAVNETYKKLGCPKGKENMGKLMGMVMGQLKGKADGTVVKEVVEDFLT